LIGLGAAYSASAVGLVIGLFSGSSDGFDAIVSGSMDGCWMAIPIIRSRSP